MKLLPEASTIANTTDKIFVFLFLVSLAFLVFITTLMVGLSFATVANVTRRPRRSKATYCLKRRGP